MSRRPSFSVYCIAIALVGAAALSADAQEPTRYRMIEGSTLALWDPSGALVELVPLHGTFDLIPGTGMYEFFVEQFRGFDETGTERVTGEGEYWIIRPGQHMVLDLLIDGQPHQLDSGLAPPMPGFPMIEIELVEILGTPGDPWYSMHLIAAPALGVWFSTEVPFGVPGGAIVSDGDVLTSFGAVLWTNQELTANLNIQPPVPDVGVDAINPVEVGAVPWWEAWFSTEIDVWSNTLGWLSDGDFLSEAGFVVARNEGLLELFGPMPINAGLDAITWGWWCGGWYFSTEIDFYSPSHGYWIGHGDLLCAEHGGVVFTNAELLASFQIIGPVPPDLGLDAVYMWSSGHIWFSVEDGFEDQRYGWIDEGDLLSTEGWVVYRNLDLLRRFNPIAGPAILGLDAVHVVPVERGDMNGDMRINAFDIDPFVLALTDREGYYELYPELSPDIVGDLNYDGVLNAFDIDPFVELLTGP